MTETCTILNTDVRIEQQTQHQEPFGDQIVFMQEAAERLGCQDVADWIRREFRLAIRYATKEAVRNHQDLVLIRQQRRERVQELIPQQNLRQDSFEEQMRTVIDTARRLGCYDAQENLARRVGWTQY